MAKFIFVTGGVLSSLGKGIAAASIASLLKQSGLKVSILKADPYINIDPGTMSPLEHGEVFVTKDGAETDLDLGHYERFLDEDLTHLNNFTTGKVYQSVIEKERRGEYLGKTIQVIPHIVGEIASRMEAAAADKDVLVVEIGGTVGDIEGLPFLEAIRSLGLKHGRSNVFYAHLTLVPFIKVAGELKTKPTQHSVGELRRIGISPDMIIARSEIPLGDEIKEKIARSCGVEIDCVIESIDAKSIYQIPLKFLEQNILLPIAKHLNLKLKTPNLKDYENLVEKIINPSKKTKIAFVGKYIDLKESYKSLTEALIHAGANLDTKVEINWIDSEEIKDENDLAGNDGILVAGGFGQRGVEGKIKAIKYARENNIPFLGICLGMQLSLIEFARNVLKLEDANSTEFDENTKNPIIYLIDEFINQSGSKEIRTIKTPLGGTLRLGEYVCNIKEGSLLNKLYNSNKAYERHRHRYEANSKYRKLYEENGLCISGESNGLIEAIENTNNDFFVAVQYHPEFTSRLTKANPVILGFIKQCLN
ncbi:CTP synthetase [Campylobacter sp. RM5004]|uniref:CTP synthase n=1 Tax=Campylobacter sp. RM5004 TaxID=1660078 RepID=UPI001EFA456D|nr:CTP synthase [Campylobacter sp. RM5004]ULO00674.1 CTP synthetase [Campylobacter sp. RM5004]